MHRRQFLQNAAFALGGLACASEVLQAAEALEAVSQKPKRVGLIGTGWYGKSDLFRLIQVAPVEVVSLCDPDKQLLAEAAELVSQRQKSKKVPRTYGDYRQMLQEKDLDIVLIGTPDHWHALQMIDAVESGADVYVQKPISVDVLEGEAMLAAARKHEPRRPGRHAAQEHPALDRRQEEHRRRGPVGQDRPRGSLLLLPHARQRQSAASAGAGLLRLRDVDRPGAAAALRRPAARPLVAHVHGIRQRHHGRYVRSHARYRTLDAGPGLAEAGHLVGRHLRSKRRQIEHLRTPRPPPSNTTT